MTVAPVRDGATARSIGLAGLGLVCCWGLVGGLLLLGRVLLATVATPDLQAPYALALVSAAILSLSAWLASLVCLALGLAVSVASLVVADRVRRAAAFFALVTLCGATQYVLETLRSTTTWDAHPDRLAETVATIGVFVAPAAGVVVALVLLGPVVRRPRSTRAPAAAG